MPDPARAVTVLTVRPPTWASHPRRKDSFSKKDFPSFGLTETGRLRCEGKDPKRRISDFFRTARPLPSVSPGHSPPAGRSRADESIWFTTCNG
ncbi:MAG: hypothetical protein C0617_07685 [Desulfuromonas sp.]|nr:MAG: hypothetical protein C0617_07685 [Desulfuromonas sp.]